MKLSLKNLNLALRVQGGKIGLLSEDIYIYIYINNKLINFKGKIIVTFPKFFHYSLTSPLV